MLRMCLVSLVALLSLSGRAGATEWGADSARLELGMTQEQVVEIAGRPAAVEMMTCGTASEHGSWRCRILVFGQAGDGMTVWLEETDGGAWVVNSWLVSP